MSPDSQIEEHFRINEFQKNALKKLDLNTMRDLLFHFPSRYADIPKFTTIKDLVPGHTQAVYGKISSLKTAKAFRKKIPMAECTLEDSTGKIKVVWFNQPYIAKMLENISYASLQGRVTQGKKGIYLANPEFEKTGMLPIDVGDSLFSKEEKSSLTAIPVYPESRGITSKWFYHAIQKILKSSAIDEIKDPIPEHILKKYSLPSLKSALIWVHTPKLQKHSESARKRFAFEEVFFIQLSSQKQKREYADHQSFVVKPNKKEIDDFTKRFPFKPTKAQSKAIDTILKDFKSGTPMMRLLEGDVGSGKTAVAATASYLIITTPPEDAPSASLQVAYMAPTEILAKQHFESFIEYFKHLNINIGLITSSGCQKFPSKVSQNEATNISRSQLLKWIMSGEIHILIGTHALIQKSIKFKHLGLVIIDEQHRFGTAQRQTLSLKDQGTDKPRPHLLSMTATPIPRTLALTIYGNLDLTLLDEMPRGRKPIMTSIVIPNERSEVYEKIRAEIKAGRQCYVICPRIDEPDPEKALALNVKSVKEEAARLKARVFPEFEIEILHGKMKPKEKDEVMEDFASGDINILVATSVVEVGVNVPNATIILIEGSERFGLAQLHQLRGRVIRSNHQAYCYIFTSSKSSKVLPRLQAIKKARNGFDLAEMDLQIRGSGGLAGGKQWGISDIGMEAIKNIKMVEAAREEAKKLLEEDVSLETYPLLKLRLNKEAEKIHFE